MISYFADTFYFLALLNADDPAHDMAVELSDRSSARIVTTAWVLTELGDAMCAPSNRQEFQKLLDYLEQQAAAEIVSPSESLFRAGVKLYSGRPDKSWSLTDCISFVVMQDYGIAEALTADHHFEQAGFTALMK